MKPTDEELENLLQQWAREKRAERKATLADDVAPATKAPARTSGARWLPLAAAVAASAIVSTAIVHFQSDPARPLQDEVRWIEKSIPKEAVQQLPFAEAKAAGWRRAALLLTVGDYSAFQNQQLPNLPAARDDAARVGRWYQSLGGAARENVIALTEKSATEPAARAAVQWLKNEFSQPGDLLLVHVSTHGWRSADGRLRIVLSDSRGTSDGGGGLPIEALLDPLAGTPGYSGVVLESCFAGAAGMIKPGPRQCVVAATGDGTPAFDACFGKHWMQALDGAGDSNSDGVVTLAEAFAHTAHAMTLEHSPQAPHLFEGEAGLADRIALSFHRDVARQLPKAGAPAVAPSVIEFIPDRRAELFLDGESLGGVGGVGKGLPILLWVAPGKHLLRSVLHGAFGAPDAAWESGSFEVPTGGRIQQTPTFPATKRGQNATLRLVGGGAELSAGPFPKIETTGTAVRARHTDGILIIDAAGAASVGGGSVLLAADVANGVDLASALGVAADAHVTVELSAKVDSGKLPVRFYAGGRASESLTPRVEKQAELDSQWQSISLTLPASRLDRLVTGFGVQIDGEPEIAVQKIFIRDVTFRPASE